MDPNVFLSDDLGGNMCLTLDETKEMLNYMADKIIMKEPLLTEIDSKIGDGDHGIGMKIGFSELKKKLPLINAETVNDLFKETGMILLDAMGGASGVIFGTLFISGYAAVDKVDFLNLKILTKMLDKSLEAIKYRGKAKVGDKTMIDSLEPAVLKLKEISGTGCSFEEGIKATAEAAWTGVENSKMYEAKKGRAQSYGIHSLGLPDPGAVSVALILESIAEFVQEKEKIK